MAFADSNSFTVAPLTVPAWFLSMTQSTWATPVTNTLASVRARLDPAANPNAPNSPPWQEDTFPNGCETIMTAWSGGAVDEVNGMYVVYGAGHSTYGGNEPYGVRLRTASPAWERMRNPSLNSSLSAQEVARAGNARYPDGQPSTSHTYGRLCWGAGKLWMAGVDSNNGAVGWHTASTFSFDPVTRAWTWWGNPIPNPVGNDSFWKWLGGTAAFDTSTGKLWSIAQYGITDGTTPAQSAFSLDTTKAVDDPTRFTVYNWHWSGSGVGMASFILPAERVWVLLGPNGGVWTVNLDNPAAGMSSRSVTGSGYAGGAYHTVSRSLLAWNNSGRNILKLKVPPNPFTGTYVWSTVTPGSGGATPSAAPIQGTYNRFNVIQDMGNGQGACVLANAVTGPVYVYKLPVGGV